MISIVDIQRITAKGDRDIAERFSLGQLWVPLRLDVHFVDAGSSGTTVAPLTFDMASDLGADYNVRLSSPSPFIVGLNYDFAHTWPLSEWGSWLMLEQETLCVNWTNPQTGGKLKWGMTLRAGLVRLTT